MNKYRITFKWDKEEFNVLYNNYEEAENQLKALLKSTKEMAEWIGMRAVVKEIKNDNE